MKIVSVGGGPAGLFFSILMKKRDPSHEVAVFERNGPDDTFGWGVVFSDETLGNIAEADPATHAAMAERFAAWTDIDVWFGGERIRSTGHGFCGLSRRSLLNVLQDRCRALGVHLVFGREVNGREDLGDAALVVGADGAASRIREQYATHFKPSLDFRKCRYCWLGTDLQFEAFTFLFKESPHGLFQVHAYPFEAASSTFIVECREEVWRRAGLHEADEATTVAYLEALFAEELRGHRLRTNRSIWRTFATVRNATWRHENVVLLGDAAHTAHFSIGSGTKLAMEDSIALAQTVGRHGRDVPAALAQYEDSRFGEVARLQRAAQTSLEWFENTGRYRGMAPLQFAFSLLTRSKRITFDNLRQRDPALVTRVTRWFDEAVHAGDRRGAGAERPPLFQPFRLRGMTLANRVVVSPMCQYSCEDGTPNDWHLVHLGSRALGGAGLVFTEATHVSPDGRISPACAGMYRGEHGTAWGRIVDFVHSRSAAKIGMQLAHSGRKGSCNVPWEGGLPLREGAWETLSPSALPFAPDWPAPRAMNRAEMKEVCGEFVRAARLAAEAGFDILELHMAHGYLLGCFISPLANRREDDYGGSLDNRIRFPLEVFDAVRAVWPAERPMSVRISATDWKPEGLSSEDRVGLARRLKDHGCDVIDVSGGQTVSDQQPIYGRMFQVPFSDEIRHEAGIPTMAVGNIQDADQCNTILAAGRADLCVLARAHLSDPYFTLHAASAYGYDDQPWPSQYLAAKPASRGAAAASRRKPEDPGDPARRQE